MGPETEISTALMGPCGSGTALALALAFTWFYQSLAAKD